MIKKIIFTIISLAILYFGYQSFNRLRYWDRSVQIFKTNSNQPFGRGGFDRGRGSFMPNRGGERTARPDFGNIPDSIRQQFAQQAQQQFPRRPQLPDQPSTSSRHNEVEELIIPDEIDRFSQQIRVEIQDTNRTNFSERGSFIGAERNRGGFPQRRNVRLNTVYRFLAVFAALTVITLYIDSFLRTRRKKKKLHTLNNS